MTKHLILYLNNCLPLEYWEWVLSPRVYFCAEHTPYSGWYPREHSSWDKLKRPNDCLGITGVISTIIQWFRWECRLLGERARLPKAKATQATIFSFLKNQCANWYYRYDEYNRVCIKAGIIDLAYARSHLNNTAPNCFADFFCPKYSAFNHYICFAHPTSNILSSFSRQRKHKKRVAKIL